MSNVFLLLFSAGGAAFVTAIIAGIKNFRLQRLDTEEALITRMNNAIQRAERDADTQRRRAERAERYSEQLRRERDASLDKVAHLRRRMISAGLTLEDDD